MTFTDDHRKRLISNLENKSDLTSLRENIIIVVKDIYEELEKLDRCKKDEEENNYYDD